MPSQLLTTDQADFASSTAGSSTTSYLIPRTLLGKVINSVRKNLVLRGLAAQTFGPSSIPGRTLVLPMQVELSANTELPIIQVSEGGEIPLGQSQWTNLTLTPVKYGVRIGVSKEMQEDGILDLLGYHAELAGYEFADNEESLIVAQLLAGATAGATGHLVANSNATLPITDITSAMQAIETYNYQPSHMVVGVEVANDLRNIDEFNNKNYGNGSIQQRLIGEIYGMKVIVSNNVSAKLAYIFDANHGFVIAEKRALTVERYSDFARDTSFVTVTQRIAVSYLRANAIAQITTT